MAHDGVNLTEVTDVSGILRLFEEHHTVPTFDPVPYLTRLLVFNKLSHNCILLIIIVLKQTCRTFGNRNRKLSENGP